MCRFGTPNRIITDLGTQFTGSVFWDFCAENMIDVFYASVAHPRCNGQVERANQAILDGIKSSLFDPLHDYGSRWPQVLPSVLWGLRTQPCKSTGYTPFFLVYGSEAILPTDLTHGAPRLQYYDEDEVEQTRQQDLDTVEEHRLAAVLQHARYEQQLRRYHDKNVRHREFSIGDLVLRRIQNMAGKHKLSPPWEGPFIVSRVIGPGTYRLQYEDGTDVPNPWNIEHLRRFYP